MRFQRFTPVLFVLLLTQSAFAVKIADITRMNGARTNVITGVGLVVGLNHTGDGKGYLPMARPLAQLMSKYSDPVAAVDVADVTNCAIVSIYATVPASGVRNGDHLDVQVVSIGQATSLKGGVLFITALNGPDGKPYQQASRTGEVQSVPFALACGALETGDNATPLTGVIHGGAVMEVDLPTKCIDDQGRFTLIIDSGSASWTTAGTMAKLINESDESGEDVAVAVDPKTVVVQIPAAERNRPDAFISNVLKLQLPPVNAQPSALIANSTVPTTTAIAAIGSNVPWGLGVLLSLVVWLFLRKSNKKWGNMRFGKFVPVLFVLLLTQSAFGVKIADITRMNGARTNVITGMGLVMGLKGTGDGGAYLPAMRPLAAMMSKYDQPASLADLSNAANVAIVSVIATLPTTGVRNGDTLDVQVVSIGAASSLKNGYLYMVSMNGPDGKPFKSFDAQGHAVSSPFALAKGELEPDDNPTPLKGTVRGGAVMEVDLPPKYIDNTGRFQLIIDQPSASWAMASTIAKLVNEASDTDNIAVALDAKNILVQIPESERLRPDSFIARILALPIPASAQTQAEARVLIDDKSGTMIVTGDVEISPVVISHKGLTITTITPPPVASARNPLVATKSSIPLDTTNQGGARLQDLANAFDQLKVPAEDRIVIIKDLYETGKLHAKLIINGQEK